ncbi:hypothetical protein [Brevundimonas subvibrioides]|uniref:Type IV pilus assembly PilZ n=1 Tax=Brevundimonas subvibrioides (strain ATCC 15264 / DSM 4735 / LMG 14903 / NBRC 16000 / CB 81) TaxID=633149 RepID=D9QKC2_BRESC|nr:hypothetical protein [Brevundimonas subvibrioides]ADK99747.1 type IV pilus assembly PilZ [Brevundimonas subvibrioides ATCC 15264]
MSLSSPHDRRVQTRQPANDRGVVIVDGREVGCLITDHSDGGVRLRLDRAAGLTRTVTLVDVGKAQAFDATLAWQKGIEAGLKLGQGASVRGLVPSRLLAAREAWVRASGR